MLFIFLKENQDKYQTFLMTFFESIPEAGTMEKCAGLVDLEKT